MRTPQPEPGNGSLFVFHVVGVEQQRTALPTTPKPFDETYEIEGEHPAEALEKLHPADDTVRVADPRGVRS
jgi:hypothetical protein